MKCIHCQGKMIKAAAPFHVDRKGYHLTLDVVPAWVCRQCGKVYFGEPEVDSIQEIIKRLKIARKNFLLWHNCGNCLS